MKKILLLIVSGLLIACMAGSAMATSIVIIDQNGQEVSNGGTIYLKVGDTVKLTPKFTYDGTDNNIAGVATSYTLNKVGIGSADPSNIELSGPATFKLPLTTSNPSIYEDKDANGEGVISVHLLGGTEKDSYMLGIGSDTFFISASVKTTTVPEFPTVALPVAAILGLVFIFGRKKEEL